MSVIYLLGLKNIVLTDCRYIKIQESGTQIHLRPGLLD